MGVFQFGGFHVAAFPPMADAPSLFCFHVSGFLTRPETIQSLINSSVINP